MKQFKQLKQEVAKEAIYNRNLKQIDPKVRGEWDSKEQALDQELHQYRF